MISAADPKHEGRQVLIVGAGPAGIAAAIRAMESGASVTVIDDNSNPGGQIWRAGNQQRSDNQSAAWLTQFEKAKIEFLSNAQVISGNMRSQTLLVETPERVLELSFERLILATGAREIFLPFPGCTLPGVMGVGGLQALAKSGMPVAGKAIVLGGSGPLLLAVAAHLRQSGAHVKLIAEQSSRSALAAFSARLLRFPSKVAQAAGLGCSSLGIPYRLSCWIEAAEGRSRLQAVRVRQGSKAWVESCDLAGVAFGLVPNTELAALFGCQLEGATVVVDDYARTSVPNIYCAGECTGVGGVDLALVEGEIAGYAAAGSLEEAQRLFGRHKSWKAFAHAVEQAFALRPELKRLPASDTLVCRCEDVSHGRLSCYPSFRAAKLHTRCGMGPCQGRICGPATELLYGWRMDSIRPPIFPARIGSLIAQDCDREQRTGADERT
ncbi:MAG: NAD(P)/FAD-dependent oxidoreductase [Acidobacteriota bacterium]|nr:NAD(P)/FAD-dependent oxidoreductase [Acidobacteriota bacterium]